MKVPQCQRVESVFSHHIQECFPVPFVAGRLKMLIERGARPIRVPGRIVLDGTKRIAGLFLSTDDIPERSAIAHFLGQRKTTVNQPPVVASLHCDNLPFRDARKRRAMMRYLHVIYANTFTYYN